MQSCRSAVLARIIHDESGLANDRECRQGVGLCMSENPIIWQPDAQRMRASAMHRFMMQNGFDSYDDLYQWSIDESAAFWEAAARSISALTLNCASWAMAITRSSS